MHSLRTCRPISTHPPCAVFRPAKPSTQLSSALDRISSFSGSSADGKTLVQSLVNDFVATSEGVDELPKLFGALRSASLLTAFSSLRGSRPSGSKALSAEKLAAMAGLPLSALSPKRSTVFAWQFAGVAVVIAVVQLVNILGMAELARPLLLAVGGALAFDQVALRGLVFEACYRTFFPRYEEKVVKHEAGHFLAAYLHGLAVRGYVLSAAEAFRAGIPGQAGTLFEDSEMYNGIKKGKVGTSIIDRFSIVSMAGIAAEALYYGEAEGGESDVSTLIGLLTGLQPPWTASDVKAQARWAVLEAIMLIRENEKAFEALCDAMRERRSLGSCILAIEENFVGIETGATDGQQSEVADAISSPVKSDRKLDDLAAREKAIVAELERIKEQVDRFEGK